jgi:hypothetical protein
VARQRTGYAEHSPPMGVLLLLMRARYVGRFQPNYYTTTTDDSGAIMFTPV